MSCQDYLLYKCHIRFFWESVVSYRERTYSRSMMFDLRGLPELAAAVAAATWAEPAGYAALFLADSHLMVFWDTCHLASGSTCQRWARSFQRRWLGNSAADLDRWMKHDFFCQKSDMAFCFCWFSLISCWIMRCWRLLCVGLCCWYRAPVHHSWARTPYLHRNKTQAIYFQRMVQE